MSMLIIPIWMIFTLVNEYSFAENTSNKLSHEEQIVPNHWMCSGFLQNIKFVKDQVYGDTDEIFLGRVGDVDVDSEGRVFIADIGNVTIQVYNPDGSYSASLGQQGRGPGEFLNITHNTQIRIQSNNIFVTGTEWIFSDKVQVFSLNDFSLSEEILFNESEKKRFSPDLENYFPRSVYPLENEHLLVAYEHLRSPDYIMRGENRIPYYLHDRNGTIIAGPVLVQKDRTYLYQVYEGRGYNYYSFPFFGKSLITVSNDGLLYTAFSDEFKIDVRTPDGELLCSIELPFQNIPITRRGLISRYEDIDMGRLDFNEGDHVALQMIREADNLPQAWPALEEMLIDDENRLWVSTIVEDFDIYEWWVLEESGQVITKFEWPRDKPIKEIRNSAVYTLETEEETCLQQVVRYGFELEAR